MIRSFQVRSETPDILAVRRDGRNNGNIPVNEVDIDNLWNDNYLIIHIETIKSFFEDKYFLLYYRRFYYIGYFVFSNDIVPVMKFKPVFISLGGWIKIFNPQHPDDFTEFTPQFLAATDFYLQFRTHVMELIDSNIIKLVKLRSANIFEIPDYYYKWFKLFKKYKTYETSSDAYMLEKKRLTDKLSTGNPDALKVIEELVGPDNYITNYNTRGGGKRSKKRRKGRAKKSRTT